MLKHTKSVMNDNSTSLQLEQSSSISLAWIVKLILKNQDFVIGELCLPAGSHLRQFPASTLQKAYELFIGYYVQFV